MGDNRSIPIIAVLGVTGSGKSTFIQALTGRDDIVAGHTLYSETSDIKLYELQTPSGPVLLADTPGFDDISRSDVDVLRELGDWLKHDSQQGRFLSGIVFLHPIINARLEGSGLRILNLFRRLLGRREHLENVLLVTTFWNETLEERGDERERLLRETYGPWKAMIDAGAKTERMARDYQRFIPIIADMTSKPPIKLQIHEEREHSRTSDATNANRTGSTTNQEFLHIVIRHKRFRKKQIAIDITSLKTDADVFRRLTRIWRTNFRSWCLITSLKCIRSIKYQLYNQENVRTMYDSSRPEFMVPPLDDSNYTYSYQPANIPPLHPLLPEEVLWDKFHHPHGSIYQDGSAERECRNRMPKRRQALVFIPHQGFPIGYGLEFVEGPNWRYLIYFECFLIGFTLLFCILWIIFAKANDKVSTSFAIGQWIFGLGQVLGVLFTALSEIMIFQRI